MPEIWSISQQSPVTAMLVISQLACFIIFGFLLSKTDIATHRLPNRLVGYWLGASIVNIGLLSTVQENPHGAFMSFLGLLLLGGGYLVVSLVSAGSMGMGDVKLAGVLGMNLGYYSLASLFSATVLTFVLATFWVLGGMLLKKLTLKSAVPFGPFMVIGAFVLLLVTQ